MMRRTFARVSPRQSPRERIRLSMRRPAAFSAAGFACEAGLAFAPDFGVDLDLAADLRGLLARDAPLPFDFALLSVIISSFSSGTSRLPQSLDEKKGAALYSRLPTRY